MKMTSDLEFKNLSSGPVTPLFIFNRISTNFEFFYQSVESDIWGSTILMNNAQGIDDVRQLQTKFR